MPKLKPMQVENKRSTDPSYALMRIWRGGVQPSTAYLSKLFNLSPEQVRRMLGR